MSDILIKDMKLPEKQVHVILNPDGLVEVLDENNVLLDEYQAVSIPPHGRCIDADALEDNNITYYAIPVLANVTDAAIREAELVIRLKDLDDAPTIIEADRLPILHGTFAASSKEEAIRRLTGEGKT